MKTVFLIVMFALLPLQVWPQDDVRAAQTSEVKAAVQSFAQKTRISLLTRGLVEVNGKIIRSRDDSFDIKVSKKIANTVAYADVLEFNGGGTFISFVPERSVRAHGLWEDIGRVYSGTRILVVYSDGKSVKGFSNSVSQTHLIMIDQNGRARVDISRDRIAAVYGLVGGYGGVKKGASNAAEGMQYERYLLVTGAFVGIGALIGLVKSDGRPILIYSK